MGEVFLSSAGRRNNLSGMIGIDVGLPSLSSLYLDYMAPLKYRALEQRNGSESLTIQRKYPNQWYPSDKRVSVVCDNHHWASATVAMLRENNSCRLARCKKCKGQIDMTNRLINKIKKELSGLKIGINTSLRGTTGKSDLKRWGNKQNLFPDWDSRTKEIAKLVEPGTSVIEFGAGRLVLKTYLPASCSYTPSDLVDRGSGTIVCDLNSDVLPQFQSYDVAVLSGVLEYINDVPRLIAHLSRCAGAILASYAVTDTNESNRRAQGWVNDYSSAQLIEIFENAGFHCDHTEKWKSQVIHRFNKTKRILT